MQPLTLTFATPRQLANALDDASAWLNEQPEDEHDSLTRAEDALHDARFYLDNYDPEPIYAEHFEAEAPTRM